MTAGFVLVVLLLSLLAPLVLYVLIRDETANPKVVDRETAERDAKAQGGLRNRGRRGEIDGQSESRTDSSERDETDSWGYSRLEDE